MLTRLKECNLNLSVEKCFFMQKIVNFLGHIVSEFGSEILDHIVSEVGIGTDPDKTEKETPTELNSLPNHPKN